MAPPWSRLLVAKKGTLKDKDSRAFNVHAFSATGRGDEIKGEAREKTGGKGCVQWRRRRRPPLPPLPPSHLRNNKSRSAFFSLALVFFALGALLVAGIASRSKAAAAAAAFSSPASSLSSFLSPSSSSEISYAPPRNWTSPPAAVRVVDGDTVVAAGIVVRLLGIDAPEDGQLCSRKRRRGGGWRRAEKDKESSSSSSSLSSFFSRWLSLRPRQAPPQHANTSYDCGAEATRALRGLVAGRSLRCERKGTDRYGRALARCFVDGKKGLFFSVVPFLRERGGGVSGGPVDIGEWMLRRGHAVSYLGFTRQYLEAEGAAKREQRGIWGGEFQLPEVWRSERRMEREARAKEQKKKQTKKQKKKEQRTKVFAKKHQKAKGSKKRSKKKN